MKKWNIVSFVGVIGEFYGRNPMEANLKLLARFYEKYPEFTDKTFLSVKGGAIIKDGRPCLNGS